jgi:hypothetical protein
VGILLEVLVKFLDKLANETLKTRDNGETARLSGLLTGALFFAPQQFRRSDGCHVRSSRAKPRVRRVSVRNGLEHIPENRCG